MANLTPHEQLMLELINRARMDPAGEAKRYKIALNEGVTGDTISSRPKQVLAGNDKIAIAADKHSNWMLANDRFSHDENSGSPVFTGAGPRERMTHAGYTFAGSWTYGENIAWRGTTDTLTAAKKAQYILQQHQDLFVDAGVQGRGHRLNILHEGFKEIGVGQQIGNYFAYGEDYNASMITQDFAASGTKKFITGVVYKDNVVADNFFSVGEQVTNMAVSSAGATTDKTGAGGGYELAFSAAGAKTVKFALASGAVTVGVTLGSTNLKLDVVNGKEVWSDTSIGSVSSNVTELHALGIGKVNLNGASSSQKMFGNDAANVIKGNGGHDVLIGDGGQDKLYGGSGHDTFVFYKGDTGKMRTTADTIYDFKPSEGDILDLHFWDANSSKSGHQSFTFIGAQGFHEKAGELHFIKDKSDTWIEGDTNGDGKADFVIHLDDPMTLRIDHFDLK